MVRRGSEGFDSGMGREQEPHVTHWILYAGVGIHCNKSGFKTSLN